LTAVAEAAPDSSERTYLVASTRERDERPGTMYNGERGNSVSYAAITISIPRTHVLGEIEWPSTPPGNPNTDFIVRQASYLDSDKEFVRALNSQFATQPIGSRKVLVFIHSYNTLFAEGLYSLAQVSHDSKSSAVPVLFTLSNLKSKDYFNHGKHAQLAEAAPQLDSILAKGSRSNSDILSQREQAVGSALGTTVTLPLTILGAPVTITVDGNR